MKSKKMLEQNLGSSNILCSTCIYYVIVEGKMVKCEKGYFKPTPIKKTTVYTPLDYDCWEYENGRI